jgi:hypothetical protein
MGMLWWRDGTVTAIRRHWRGAIELDVAVTPRTVADPAVMKALVYPDLVGRPEVGDRVLLNIGGLTLGLGTGGYAMVIALPDRLPPDPTGAGHIVKARYTPQQVVVLAADEQASPYREALVDADDLDQLPVVTADLHSALPAVLAGVRADRPDARVAYVMTDGGALPAWFSRTLDALQDILAGIVTVGQAFGGDLEATNIHSGLLAARHALHADIVVVAQGPGNLGTGSRWGFSGVAIGEAVNAAAVLGGRPVGALRLSEADPRDRHYGISHHSLTAYGRVALASADLPIPRELPPSIRPRVEAQLITLRDRHKIVEVDCTDLTTALQLSPVPLSTMGRTLTTDHLYFLTAAAAGRHAASLLPPA